MDDALKQALEAIGGRSALSRAFEAVGVKITRQAIGQWDRCPAARVLQVEQFTGVSRHLLRPDWYPPEEASK